MQDQGDHDTLKTFRPPASVLAAVDEATRLNEFVSAVALGFALVDQVPVGISKLIAAYPQLEASSPVRELQQVIQPINDHVRKETEGGHSFLLALATTRLVSILETAVNEAVVASLSFAAILERSEIRRLKGPLVEFLSVSESERGEYLADLLTQDLRANLKGGVGKYEVILDAVGLGGELHPVARRELLEMVEVRNIIIHKGGRADSRFVARCPWLPFPVGGVIQVRLTMFNGYRVAVGYYLLQIVKRWAARDGLAIELNPIFSGLLDKSIQDLAALPNHPPDT